MDHLCYSCLVFVMLLLLSIAALWSPEARERAELLALVYNVYCDFLLSHYVSWDRCGT